jgi:hypothetical protein
LDLPIPPQSMWSIESVRFMSTDVFCMRPEAFPIDTLRDAVLTLEEHIHDYYPDGSPLYEYLEDFTDYSYYGSDSDSDVVYLVPENSVEQRNHEVSCAVTPDDSVEQHDLVSRKRTRGLDTLLAHAPTPSVPTAPDRLVAESNSPSLATPRLLSAEPFPPQNVVQCFCVHRDFAECIHGFSLLDYVDDLNGVNDI